MPGLHVHPLQEERFEVLGGTMKFRYGRRKIVAEAGETVTVPAGVVHNFANPSSEHEAHVRVTVTPAPVRRIGERRTAPRPRYA